MKVRVSQLDELLRRKHAAGDRLQRRIQEEAVRPFDFSAGRFLRASLLQCRRDEHVLILTTHHMMADAWSMGILTRELWSLYEAFANEDIIPVS